VSSSNGVPKVNFNHVFNEVKRESEFSNIAKMFKNAMKTTKDNGSKGGSFCTQNTVSSNYMQVTHSWANKNKPGSTTNVLAPAP
jgi:hypothetical protein